MEYLILLYLLCFILHLFTLYELGREDTLFIRKSVTLEQLFNVAFLSAIIAVFSARIGFVLFNLSSRFLNPLVLLSDFFSRVSLIAALLGATIGLILTCRHKKLPTLRIFDFSALSLMVCLPLGILATFLLTPQSDYLLGGVLTFLCILFSLFFFKLLYPRLLRGGLKDGNIGILTIMTLSLLLGFNNTVIALERQRSLITWENGVIICTFLFFFFLLIRRDIGGRKRQPKSL